MIPRKSARSGRRSLAALTISLICIGAALTCYLFTLPDKLATVPLTPVASPSTSALNPAGCMVQPTTHRDDCDPRHQRTRNISTPSGRVATPARLSILTLASADPECSTYRMPEAWELWALDNGCSEDTLALIMQVAAEQQHDSINIGALIVSLAKPESTFREHAKGRAGERGLIQLKLTGDCSHRPAVMRKLGLDPDSEHGRLTYCVAHMILPVYDKHIAAGKTHRTALHLALTPWKATRAKALASYYDLTGESNE